MQCSSDFPVVSAIQPVLGGGFDAWVAHLDETGQSLGPVTFLGGSADDFGLALTRSATGEVALVGSTASTDFPVVDAFQPDFAKTSQQELACEPISKTVAWKF